MTIPKQIICLLAAITLGLFAYSLRAQNYRVRADAYGKSATSEETNPPSVRYAVVDLGVAAINSTKTLRVTNSGYALVVDTHHVRRWYRGQLEELTGGDDWIDAEDMNEFGTVVGGVILSNTTWPDPAIGMVSAIIEFPWYHAQGWGGSGVAAKWNPGETTATLLGTPTFNYELEDARDPYAPPFTGTVETSWAYVIDNFQIYGNGLIDYQQHSVNFDGKIYHCCTPWGSFWSGYNFTTHSALGTQYLVDSPEGYSRAGDEYAIVNARNGTTLGVSYIEEPGYAPIPQYYINDVLVEAIPALPTEAHPYNVNSQGAVLLSAPKPAPPPIMSYNAWYVYDTTSATLTTLWNQRSSGGRPRALNHRTISIVDQNGNVTTKASPQVVGFDEIAGATIWEENPKTQQYEMQYLRQLLPPDSGWELTGIYDINDNGVIAARGNYQARDANGNPVGYPQPRACLLWPMKDIYVFFGTSSISGQVPNPNQDTNLRVLNGYLEEKKWTSETQPVLYPRIFAGNQTDPPYVLISADSTLNGPLARVHVYDYTNATQANASVGMLAMRAALSTPGAYVTFNGHSNMGAGPAFTLDVGGLNGLMRACNPSVAISPVEMAAEGYNFTLRPYVEGDPANEILQSGTNVIVPFVFIPRFPNDDGIAVGGSFQVHGTGSTAYHYHYTFRDDPESPYQTLQFTLVRRSNLDLLPLRYKWFYFDACSTGRDYIEQFQHGAFFYTTDPYGNEASTKTFVKSIVEGRTETETVADIDLSDIDHQVNSVYLFRQ